MDPSRDRATIHDGTSGQILDLEPLAGDPDASMPSCDACSFHPENIRCLTGPENDLGFAQL
jgi:hypothetical protein